MIVKNKAKELAALVNDDERLREERTKARQNKDKYKGVGNQFYNNGECI